MSGFDSIVLDLGGALRRLVKALDKAEIKFALVGAVALGARGHIRNTTDIDVLIGDIDRQTALTALNAAGFEAVRHAHDYQTTLRDRRADIEIDAMFFTSGFDPEALAVQGADRMAIFDVEVPVAKPEVIAWMLLLSDQPRHEDDLLAMLRGRLFDTGVLDYLLDCNGDGDARARLTSLIAAAKKPKTT